MTTNIDGLAQFEDWYSSLPSESVDSLLSLFDATFDNAVVEHQAYLTFPPVVR